jgi:hypothetical protein
MAEDVKEKPAFPLGEIVAKRRFTLYEKSGGARRSRSTSLFEGLGG